MLRSARMMSASCFSLGNVSYVYPEPNVKEVTVESGYRFHRLNYNEIEYLVYQLRIMKLVKSYPSRMAHHVNNIVNSV